MKSIHKPTETKILKKALTILESLPNIKSEPVIPNFNVPFITLATECSNEEKQLYARNIINKLCDEHIFSRRSYLMVENITQDDLEFTDNHIDIIAAPETIKQRLLQII